MKTINTNPELQSLLAEIKQLEQELREIAKSEFPDYEQDDYFNEIFNEINLNNDVINNLIEQNQQAEQEYLAVKQQEQELELAKQQLQQQLAEQQAKAAGQ